MGRRSTDDPAINPHHDPKPAWKCLPSQATDFSWLGKVALIKHQLPCLGIIIIIIIIALSRNSFSSSIPPSIHPSIRSSSIPVGYHNNLPLTLPPSTSLSLGIDLISNHWSRLYEELIKKTTTTTTMAAAAMMMLLIVMMMILELIW